MRHIKINNFKFNNVILKLFILMRLIILWTQVLQENTSHKPASVNQIMGHNHKTL